MPSDIQSLYGGTREDESGACTLYRRGYTSSAGLVIHKECTLIIDFIAWQFEMDEGQERNRHIVSKITCRKERIRAPPP